MKSIPRLLTVLALAATPTLAQQVTIDYAHDYDFATVKTFQYVETKSTNATDQLMDGRIKDAIIHQLTTGGLRQVDSNPDVYVTYHVATKENTVLNTTAFGYGGWGPGWGRWGMRPAMGSATTTASTYTEGTLIVDGYSANDKKMIWRGSGTVTVKAKPEKQSRQIDSIVAKMGDKWQQILQGQKK